MTNILSERAVEIKDHGLTVMGRNKCKKDLRQQVSYPAGHFCCGQRGRMVSYAASPNGGRFITRV
jgi:hypothetical protein